MSVQPIPEDRRTVDPFGPNRTLASRIEEVSADEIRRRFDEAVRSASPA